MAHTHTHNMNMAHTRTFMARAHTFMAHVSLA
jgi:hypothetical protein